MKLFRISENLQYSPRSRENSFIHGNYDKNFGNNYHNYADADKNENALDVKSWHKIRRDSSLPAHPLHEAKCRRVFKNAHHYCINSVSTCADGEYYLSADDLRINLWNLERSDTCFTIVDAKPENMDYLNEIITAAQFHPQEPDIFLYSTSKGVIKLCDTRVNAICDVPTLVFEDIQLQNAIHQTEATMNISSLSFSHSPHTFLTRDYLGVCVWDLRMSKNAVENYVIQDFLNNEEVLSTMYDQECLFDRFDARFNKDDNSIVTGTYNGMFAVKERATGKNAAASFYMTNLEFMGHGSTSHNLEPYVIPNENGTSLEDSCKIIDPCDMKFDQKVTTLDCHPTENLLAIGAEHMLLIVKSDS